MTTHARLPPSSRYRWAACPGSVREEAKYPEQDSSSPGAIDGTHSHTLLEHCLKNGLWSVESVIGMTLSDHEGSFVVDAARGYRVQEALDYVYKRCHELNAPVIYAESRVDPEYLLGRSDMAGTVDIQIHAESDGVLELIDYKDGMNPVEAEGNEQLEQYAFGVLAGLKIPINLPYPFHTVRMTIIQPKMALRNLPIITSHDVNVKKLIQDDVGTIILQAKATDDPNAPLVPGEKQCKYCRAAGSCAARANHALSSAGLVFPSIFNQPAEVREVTPTSFVDELSHQSALTDPNTLSDDKLVQIIEATPLIKQMIEKAEEEALRRMKSGISMKGLKVVSGRGSREWALPEEEMASRLTKMGIPKSEIYETKLISPVKAEKLTWTKKDELKKLSERQLKTLETEYISKKAGKLTVALESDNRPAVVFDAAPLFSAVTVEEKPEEIPAWLLGK